MKVSDFFRKKPLTFNPGGKSFEKEGRGSLTIQVRVNQIILIFREAFVMMQTYDPRRCPSRGGRVSPASEHHVVGLTMVENTDSPDETVPRPDLALQRFNE